MSEPDRRTILALCVVEDALHDCQYVGVIAPPAWGLRLALAWLFEIAGDDPGVAAKSREPFDMLWRLVTGIEPLFGGSDPERMRSTFARTQYAQIRRMIRFPQTLANDEVIGRWRRRGEPPPGYQRAAPSAARRLGVSESG